jgi:predicted histone-like DNA-binding protein
MLKYKLLGKRNPRQPAEPVKYYACLITSGKKDLQRIASDIAQRSSLSRGDVYNVLEQLVELFPQYLTEGQTINLGALGNFRLSAQSAGKQNPDDFTVHDIKGLRILFKPGKQLQYEVSKAQFSRSL